MTICECGHASGLHRSTGECWSCGCVEYVEAAQPEEPEKEAVDRRCPEHGLERPCAPCIADALRRGEANKARKMELVQHAPSDEELDAAKKAWLAGWSIGARLMCEDLSDFTGDQLLTMGYMPRPPGDGRIVGPAMARLGRLGWAAKTNVTRKSTNPDHNCQPREVWISTLYDGGVEVAICSVCEGKGLVHRNGGLG